MRLALALSLTSLSLLAMAAVEGANLSITVTHDAFPEETIWTFANTGTGMELFRQENGTWTTADPVNRTETFLDLPTGNYSFRIEDTNMDGICCTNGTGAITFSNETEVLYYHKGTFQESLEINVQVDSQGRISSIAPAVDAALRLDWPGFSGDALDHSFTVNVQFEDVPQNITVEIWKKDDTYFNPGWIRPPFLWYAGVQADANTVWHETFENLVHGLYFVRISATGTAGIGWATVTNRTDVVWQVSGDDFANALGHQAEFFMIVKGVHGYTFETAWDGNGDDPP